MTQMKANFSKAGVIFTHACEDLNHVTEMSLNIVLGDGSDDHC